MPKHDHRLNPFARPRQRRAQSSERQAIAEILEHLWLKLPGYRDSRLAYRERGTGHDRSAKLATIAALASPPP